eukprot:scaffold5176_cov65-Attheya_sp.AAC.1
MIMKSQPMADQVKRNEMQEIESSFAFRITPESSQLPHQLDGIHCGAFALYYVLCKLFGVTPSPTFDTEQAMKMRDALGLFFIRSAYHMASTKDEKVPWIVPILSIPVNIVEQNNTESEKSSYRRRKSDANNFLHEKKKAAVVVGNGLETEPIVLYGTPKRNKKKKKRKVRSTEPIILPGSPNSLLSTRVRNKAIRDAKLAALPDESSIDPIVLDDTPTTDNPPSSLVTRKSRTDTTQKKVPVRQSSRKKNSSKLSKKISNTVPKKPPGNTPSPPTKSRSTRSETQNAERLKLDKVVATKIEERRNNAREIVKKEK